MERKMSREKAELQFEDTSENPWYLNPNKNTFLNEIVKRLGDGVTDTDWKVLKKWFNGTSYVENFEISAAQAKLEPEVLTPYEFRGTVTRLHMGYHKIIEETYRSGGEHYLKLKPPYWMLANEDFSPIATIQPIYRTLSLAVGEYSGRTIGAKKSLTCLIKRMDTAIFLGSNYLFATLLWLNSFEIYGKIVKAI